jgi:sterol desaturase/sphingolipid hydroxylase (fatty acid hydroxylase superfamily)
MDALLKRASEVYALDYFGIIIVVSLLECVVPRRHAGGTLRRRWLSNFGIAVIGAVVIRSLFPVVGVGWAMLCGERGWGLFNRIASPAWLTAVVAVAALDLVAYGQHYLLHRVSWLWRAHRTHHSDQDCDFSTAARFHPLETTYTTAVTLGAIAALGAPPLAVFVSQLVSTAIGFAEHANVRLPSSLDRALRLLVVTPDMHRIHHSQDGGESRMNLGGTFSWWDRLFGTYIEHPARGQDDIVFGVEGFTERKHLMLQWMLAQPFLPEQPEDPAASPPVRLAPASRVRSPQ